MKKTLIALLATAAFVSTSALAADLAVKAPVMKAPPPPALSWTGCYLDGGVGYGMWNQDHFTEHRTTAAGPLLVDTVGATDGGRGWLGRLGAGCDYQFTLAGFGTGQWVIGILGDYDFMSLKGTNTEDTSALPGAISPFFGLAGSEKETSAWNIGVRLGYLPYPNLLTFVSGGYSQTRFGEVDFVTSDASGFVPGSASGSFVPATTYTGWFIGGGTEYRLPFWQNLAWKTEYRFASYGAKDLFNQCGGGLCGTAGAELFGENSHKYVQTVTSSLVWRFDWGGPVVARY